MLPKDKKCPNCEKTMVEGYMLGGYNHHLQWFAKGFKPSAWDQIRNSIQKESTEDMVNLSSARMDCDQLPALHCPACKLVLLDYSED